MSDDPAKEAVERKQPDFWFSAGSVKLYLEDLEEIDRIVRSLDSEITIEVSTDEATYTVSGPEHLAGLSGGEALRAVKWDSWSVRAGTPTVQLSAKAKHAYVTGKQAIRGPLEQVADVLRRRRRPLAVIHTFRGLLLVWALLGLVVISAVLGTNSLKRAGAERLADVVSGLLFAAIVVFTFYSARLAWRPVVILRVHRHDRPSFWRRNRDQLTVAMIAASFGAAVTALVAYLLSRR